MYTRQSIIDDLKVIINETDDLKLNLYVKLAEDYVKKYCNIDEILEEMQGIILEIACFKYNTLIYSGINSQGLGSASVSFNQNTPEEINKQLRKYCKLRKW